MKKQIHLILMILIISLTSLKAAIIYTDVADATLQSAGTIAIDFDGTGGAEITFEDVTGGFGPNPEPGVLLAATTANEDIVTEMSSHENIVSLPLNTSIGATSFWSNQFEVHIDWPGGTPFPSNADAYIGVRFELGAATHYGWIRVNWNGTSLFIIKDFAYEDTPDMAISAGDKGSSIQVTSITVQGFSGVSSITTVGGTLQMEASVLPMDATDHSLTWSVTNGTGNATINAVSGLLTAVADGMVTVTATANDGSGISGSTNITISNQGLSIKELAIKGFSVYPNPTKEVLNIDLDLYRESDILVNITNLLGQTVYTFNNHLEGGLNLKIDTKSYKKGAYLYQITIDGSSVQKGRFAVIN